MLHLIRKLELEKGFVFPNKHSGVECRAFSLRYIMSGPTQDKVTDETWDDERVRSFLDRESVAGVDTDYHALEAAYRHMRLSDFERFLSFFSAAGRNLDATDPMDRTLWSIISEHRQGAAFIEARKRQI